MEKFNNIIAKKITMDYKLRFQQMVKDTGCSEVGNVK